jgi:putative oxidoreductase
MATQARSSHQVLSHTDSFAESSTDTLILIGRVLLGWIFVAAGWGKLGNMAGFAGYLTSLGVPAPGLMSMILPPVEFLIGVALVLGIATRYASIACIVFVVLATAIAHRYWEFPAAQQVAQYNNFLKNLSIVGGTLLLFVTGAGRFSLDNWLVRRR